MGWRVKDIVDRLQSIEARTDQLHRPIEGRGTLLKVTRPLIDLLQTLKNGLFYSRLSVIFYIGVGMFLGSLAATKSSIPAVYWAVAGVFLAIAVNFGIRYAKFKRDSHYRE